MNNRYIVDTAINMLVTIDTLSRPILLSIIDFHEISHANTELLLTTIIDRSKKVIFSKPREAKLDLL